MHGVFIKILQWSQDRIVYFSCIMLQKSSEPHFIFFLSTKFNCFLHFFYFYFAMLYAIFNCNDFSKWKLNFENDFEINIRFHWKLRVSKWQKTAKFTTVQRDIFLVLEWNTAISLWLTLFRNRVWVYKCMCQRVF